MFSKRFQKISLLRLYYWQINVITPFKWNRKTGKVMLSSNRIFRLWSILLLYMSFFTGSTFLSSISLLVTYSENIVTLIVTTSNFAIIGSTALMGFIVVYQKRAEFAEFINQAFYLDEYLQGNLHKYILSLE